MQDYFCCVRPSSESVAARAFTAIRLMENETKEEKKEHDFYLCRTKFRTIVPNAMEWKIMNEPNGVADFSVYDANVWDCVHKNRKNSDAQYAKSIKKFNELKSVGILWNILLELVHTA